MILFLFWFVVHARCYKICSFLHISNALITFQISPFPSLETLIHTDIRTDVGDDQINMQFFLSVSCKSKFPKAQLHSALKQSVVLFNNIGTLHRKIQQIHTTFKTSNNCQG